VKRALLLLGAVVAVGLAAWGVSSWVMGGQAPRPSLREASADAPLTPPQAPPAEGGLRWGHLLRAPGLGLINCASVADHPGQAAACVAVTGGGALYVLNPGEGAVAALLASGAPLERIVGVLLSDLSGAAMGDLDDLRDATFLAGRPEPLAVYGPPGTARVVEGLNQSRETADAETLLALPQGVVSFTAAPLVAVEVGADSRLTAPGVSWRALADGRGGLFWLAEAAGDSAVVFGPRPPTRLPQDVSGVGVVIVPAALHAGLTARAQASRRAQEAALWTGTLRLTGDMADAVGTAWQLAPGAVVVLPGLPADRTAWEAALTDLDTPRVRLLATSEAVSVATPE